MYVLAIVNKLVSLVTSCQLPADYVVGRVCLSLRQCPCVIISFKQDISKLIYGSLQNL